MRRYRACVALCLMLLICVFALGACGSSTTSTAATTSGGSTTSASGAVVTTAPATTTQQATTTATAALAPYRVGLITSITGVMASMGTGVRDATLLAAEEINAKGGINGHPVEVIVYNDESDPSKGVIVAKKLISEDKVLAIMGPISTGIAIAVADLAEKSEVPTFVQNSSSASVALTGWKPPTAPAEVRKWVFKLGIDPTYFILDTYKMMAADGNIKKIAFLGANNAMGQAFKQTIELTYKAAGLEVVAWEQYEPADTDMTAQLTRIKSANPDAIYLGGAEMAGGIAYKQARSLGLTQPIYGAPPLVMFQIVDSLGASLDGLKVPAYLIQFGEGCPTTDPQYKAVIALTNGIKAKTGARADTGHGSGYDTMYLFADALTRANPDLADLTKARAAFRDALGSTKGFVGSYLMGDMTAWHDLPAPYLPCEVKDKQLKITGDKLFCNWQQ
jgi:branched-chain amino acid transport system substrate-binding protein